jgi:hypothetical protein
VAIVALTPTFLATLTPVRLLRLLRLLRLFRLAPLLRGATSAVTPGVQYCTGIGQRKVRHLPGR